MQFRPHHVALSVRDLPATIAFYRTFGFEPVFRMDDVDLSIVHLAGPDGAGIEVFHYPENEGAPRLQASPGNDMQQVGVKHVAFDVDDVHAVRAGLERAGHQVTEIRHGRAGVDYFFVTDPDGMWVEVLCDERDLPADVTIERER
ncbi:MAG TPA: VOC family protein [Acidimicrobiia bacterium]|nr:VOC family protein [Acidimicrobiia bacterium]